MAVHFGRKTNALNITDLYAAYSLRKVVPDYAGPCIRILNSGDATQYDIYFSDDVAPGFLDYYSMLGTLGPVNTGTVTIWYDQSGNGHDAAVGPTQPTIWAGGVWYRTGGKKNLPMIGFDGGSGEEFYASTFAMAQPDQFYFLAQDSAATGVHFLDGNSARQISGGSGGTYRFFYAGASIDYGLETLEMEQHFTHFEGTSSLASLNGAIPTAGNPGTASISGLYIGAYRSYTNGIIGGFQEILCYTSDNATMKQNRPSIIRNQYEYFKPY